jgi:hypothetical protein
VDVQASFAVPHLSRACMQALFGLNSNIQLAMKPANEITPRTQTAVQIP